MVNTNKSDKLIIAINIILFVGILFGASQLFKISRQYSLTGANFSFTNALSALNTVSSTDIYIATQSADIKNILILGVAGPNNSAPDLTDTIMLFSLNIKTGQTKIFSFPRDLWVNVPGQNYYSKLNSLYQLDKNNLIFIKTKIEEISGLKINDYAIVNLSSAKEIIDQIGGVDVDVPYPVYDKLYPGVGYTYEEFKLDAGLQHLNGDQAIKYMRTRHRDNDYGRMSRQQQVIKAVAQKVSQLNPILHFGTYLSILNTAIKNIKTNLDVWEIKNLWQIFGGLGDNSINATTFNAGTLNSLFVGSNMEVTNGNASIVLPKAGLEHYDEIREYIKNIK